MGSSFLFAQIFLVKIFKVEKSMVFFEIRQYKGL
jgi:hypothetical protein